MNWWLILLFSLLTTFPDVEMIERSFVSYHDFQEEWNENANRSISSLIDNFWN